MAEMLTVIILQMQHSVSCLQSVANLMCVVIAQGHAVLRLYATCCSNSSCLLTFRKGSMRLKFGGVMELTHIDGSLAGVVR